MTKTFDAASDFEKRDRASLENLGAVTVHFDVGRDQDGDPLVWASVNAWDLVKLPVSFAESLRPAQGGDPQGTDMFFVGSDAAIEEQEQADHLHIYVDTERKPEFLAELKQACAEVGLDLLRSDADLRRHHGPSGDVVAPALSDFMAADMSLCSWESSIDWLKGPMGWGVVKEPWAPEDTEKANDHGPASLG